MDRPRLIRGLRIAVSAVCGLVCALMIVLWVRSYAYCDIFGAGLTKTVQLYAQSKQGELSVRVADEGRLWTHSRSWYLNSTSMQQIEEMERRFLRNQPVRWGPRFYVGNNALVFPQWCLIVVSGIAAAGLRTRRRYKFSLRTLLIATTLIAVVLGLVVWASS